VSLIKIDDRNLRIKIETLYNGISELNNETESHSSGTRNWRQLTTLQDVVSTPIRKTGKGVSVESNISLARSILP
jgi:hypothetical protein